MTRFGTESDSDFGDDTSHDFLGEGPSDGDNFTLLFLRISGFEGDLTLETDKFFLPFPSYY